MTTTDLTLTPLEIVKIASASVPTPPAGYVTLFVDSDNKIKQKNSSGTVTDLTDTGAGGSDPLNDITTYTATANNEVFTAGGSEEVFMVSTSGFTGVSVDVTAIGQTAGRKFAIYNVGSGTCYASDVNGSLTPVCQPYTGALFMSDGTANRMIASSIPTDLSNVQSIAEKYQGLGYAGIDSLGLFVGVANQEGMTVPKRISINVQHPDGTSKGLDEWYETITNPAGINFDGTETITLSPSFESSASILNATNAPDMLDLEYVTATPVASSMSIDVYAKFKFPIDGEVFFSLQIKKDGLTV